MVTQVRLDPSWSHATGSSLRSIWIEWMPILSWFFRCSVFAWPGFAGITSPIFWLFCFQVCRINRSSEDPSSPRNHTSNWSPLGRASPAAWVLLLAQWPGSCASPLVLALWPPDGALPLVRWELYGATCRWARICFNNFVAFSKSLFWGGVGFRYTLDLRQVCEGRHS